MFEILALTLMIEQLKFRTVALDAVLGDHLDRINLLWCHAANLTLPWESYVGSECVYEDNFQNSEEGEIMGGKMLEVVRLYLCSSWLNQKVIDLNDLFVHKFLLCESLGYQINN